MPSSTVETVRIRSGEDIVRLRQWVRARAVEIGFGLVDQTKLITAASELARNIVDHAGADGVVSMETVSHLGRQGLRLAFEDKGPGIADIPQAMKDGFTTGHGLGLGLGGAKRLVNEFEIVSRPGEGTRVVITRWK
ncbi:anti-sigma regulatory factor [Candidatus Nitrospira bockiana]